MSEATTPGAALTAVERAFVALTEGQEAAVRGAVLRTSTITHRVELTVDPPIDVEIFSVGRVRITALSASSNRSVGPVAADEDDQPFRVVKGYGRKLNSNGAVDNRTPRSEWFSLTDELAPYLLGVALTS